MRTLPIIPIVYLCMALIMVAMTTVAGVDTLKERKYAEGGGPEVEVLEVEEGRPIVRIKNFLPAGTASKLLRALRGKKRRWVFATNEGNRKIKSNDNIEGRREISRRKMESGAFAYAKFELDSQRERLYNKIWKMFSSKKVRKKISLALAAAENGHAPAVRGITDLFVAKYAQGDFLSPHNDAFGGSITFILNLTPKWRNGMGGHLDFFCKSNSTWCHSERPTWNSLLIFRSRPASITHRVNMVQHGERFSITGWYLDDKDVWTEEDEAQCSAMRSGLPCT